MNNPQHKWLMEAARHSCATIGHIIDAAALSAETATRLHRKLNALWFEFTSMEDTKDVVLEQIQG